MSQITTHILDTAQGVPASGVALSLAELRDGQWHELARSHTNEDGRAPGLIAAGVTLAGGTYRMRFETAAYLNRLGRPVFYPWVEVVFNLDGGGEHHHIPLLLSPFGYSTYRGS